MIRRHPCLATHIRKQPSRLFIHTAHQNPPIRLPPNQRITPPSTARDFFRSLLAVNESLSAGSSITFALQTETQIVWHSPLWSAPMSLPIHSTLDPRKVASTTSI